MGLGFQSGAYRVPLQMYEGMFMRPGWMDKIFQSALHVYVCILSVLESYNNGERERSIYIYIVPATLISEQVFPLGHTPWKLVAINQGLCSVIAYSCCIFNLARCIFRLREHQLPYLCSSEPASAVWENQF